MSILSRPDTLGTTGTAVEHDTDTLSCQISMHHVPQPLVFAFRQSLVTTARERPEHPCPHDDHVHDVARCKWLQLSTTSLACLERVPNFAAKFLCKHAYLAWKAWKHCKLQCFGNLSRSHAVTSNMGSHKSQCKTSYYYY